MLSELRITNFALFESQSILFGSGLNVISGETGSGKSIVLQALEMILGARAKAQYIRAGCDALTVEAVFELSALAEDVRAGLPEIARGDELVVSRSVNTAGKGRVLINGQLGSVALLEDIVGRIVNICGQGSQGRLLDSRYHLELVDDFSTQQALLAEYRSAYQKYRELSQKLETLESNAARGAARSEELRLAIDELTPLKPVAGLREELEATVRRHANAEGILSKSQELLEVFRSSDGLSSRISQLSGDVAELVKLDPDMAEGLQLIKSAQAELAEVESLIEKRSASVDVNATELEALRDRLAEVARLERKYRSNSEGLALLLSDMQAELSGMEGGTGLKELRAECAAAQSAAEGLAKKLSQVRKKAALKLSSAVEAELAELSMADAKLRVNISELSECGPDGLDKVFFEVQPNKGEGYKPLSQIASGGELSRIMLVMKKLLGDRQGVNVLIFDEVDTGISGAVARAVGEKLKALAQQSQVLCITHLAQVASMADHHFLVSKLSGERTVSLVRELPANERVEEIARMLAGYNITKASRESARELLASNCQ